MPTAVMIGTTSGNSSIMWIRRMMRKLSSWLDRAQLTRVVLRVLAVGL